MLNEKADAMSKLAMKNRSRGALNQPRVLSNSDPLGHRKAAGVVKRKSADTELQISKARFEAVMQAAERSGLLGEKSSRIAGRISPALLDQARRQTGIEGASDLIAFALASIALEDDFAAAFKESRGKAPGDLKLGF